MRRNLGLIGVIAVVCMFVTGSAGAAETAEPPLAFAETGALQTTCAKLSAGVNVSIRNETAARQRVNLLPLEFKSGDTAVAGSAVCGGLSVKVPPRLGGGRTATATLRAKKKRGGEFSGSLLLFAKRGRVTRREVSISPKVPAKALEATPLVESASAALSAWDRGPIWIPVEGSAGDLPRPPAGDALTVGAVSGANGTAAVVYGGRERLTKSAAKVKLELETEGLRPGTYKGKVDLYPSDEEGGSVELEVKVAACWAIAAVLLLLGILVAFPLQRLAGRRLPLVRLRGRILGLSARHDKAAARLKAAAGKAKAWGTFTVKDIASLQADLEEQLNSAIERVAIQIDKKVLESLESAIAVVEAEIDLLKEIPKHAEDLEEELEKLEAERPKDMEPLQGTGAAQDRPSLDAEARKALWGKPVRAATLKPLIEEIDARSKQVRTLQMLEGRLESLKKARGSLDRLNKSKAKLEELDRKLNTIGYLLWTAETADDLDTAATEIQDAAKKTAELWYELPNAPHPPADVLRHASQSRPLLAAASAAVELQPQLLGDEGVVIETLEVPQGAPSAPSAPPSLPDTPPAPELDLGSAEREVHRAFWAQCLAIAIAAFVTLASGLIALYAPNETWGSYWDYLAAAIWGLGLQASVSALATAVDGLGLLRRG